MPYVFICVLTAMPVVHGAVRFLLGYASVVAAGDRKSSYCVFSWTHGWHSGSCRGGAASVDASVSPPVKAHLNILSSKATCLKDKCSAE